MNHQTSNGRILTAAGPEDAEHRVLCLPGGLANAAFFDDVLQLPEIEAGNVRLFATTLPGFGGIPFPSGFDASIEAHAGHAAALAGELGCDAVMGHSFGANVAIEMATSGLFDGHLFLLAPSFSLEDEFTPLLWEYRIDHVPGLRRLVWAAMMASMSKMLAGEVPADRVDALVAEMRKNEPGPVRANLRQYVPQLRAAGSLAGPLCSSGVRADVVFGTDKSEVGLTADERTTLEACETTELHWIEGAGHMALNQQPGEIGEIVARAFSPKQAPEKPSAAREQS